MASAREKVEPMETADNSIDGSILKFAAGMGKDVDDACVTAAGDYDESLRRVQHW